MFYIYKIGKELEGKTQNLVKGGESSFQLDLVFPTQKNDIHISATNQKSHDLGIYSILYM